QRPPDRFDTRLDARPVRDVERDALSRDLAERVLHPRLELLDDAGPALPDDGSRGRQELVVRHDGAPVGPRHLQEPIAAPEGLLVRCRGARERGVHLLEDAVQERAARLGGATRERDVARMKEHHRQRADPNGAGARALLVQGERAALRAREADLGLEAVRLRREARREKRSLAFVRDQVVTRGAAEALERAEVVDGLEQVALALAVVAEEDVEARAGREVEVREVAKAPDQESLD